MKRFWEKATVASSGESFAILLDGRPARTPGRQPLSLPAKPLADAIAREWQDAPKEFRPASLSLTSLALIAIDHVTPAPEDFALGLARYAESDLLCYRALAPEKLVARQAAAWDPWLLWAEEHLSLRFGVTAGVMPLSQPAETLVQLRATFLARRPMELAGLAPLIRISGSAILGLALSFGALTPKEAFAAATIDECWQEEFWGSDADARKEREARWQAFAAASAFLRLAAEEESSAQPPGTSGGTLGATSGFETSGC